VPLHRGTDEERVENEYVLVFLQNAEKSAIVNYMVSAVSQGIELETFQIGEYMSGAFATLTQEQLAEHLKQDDVFEYISENRIYHIAQCETQIPSEWNLERCSERTLYLGAPQGYKYDTSAGEGVTSYIIDTGVYTAHNDFGGRASWGFNGIDTNDQDCNGHGTHVASTVAGITYGVAKKTTVVGVKVLNCAGSGTSASVIRGIQWVTANARKPANANMSLGGGNDPTMISAVTASIQSGVAYAVAAGNSNANACNYSPANTPTALTVGSTTVESVPDSPNDQQEDVRSSFSNFGSCVKIFAPGTLVTAAWIGGPTAIRTISGTSMASPHIAGIVSLIQGLNPGFTPAQIQAQLFADATNNVIDLNCGTNTICNASPNRLGYHGC